MFKIQLIQKYLKVESCTNFSAPLRLKQKNSLCTFAVDAREEDCISH
jgi:hypothetical protein